MRILLLLIALFIGFHSMVVADTFEEIRAKAVHGNAEVQIILGDMYSYEGGSVQQDYAEAAKWYQLAAAQGSAEAQFNLGFLYEEGKGVPQNYAEVVKWYRKAAAQGNAGAQFSLGFLYEKGKGIPQDYAEAVNWYRKAADQGEEGHKRQDKHSGFLSR